MACSSPPRQPNEAQTPSAKPPVASTPSAAPKASGALAGMAGTPNPQSFYRSRWVAATWSDLPGWQDDNLQEAWNAWLQNCERPGPLFLPLCRDVRQLVLASDDERRIWMMAHLQPYRLESLEGNADGLLTSYYEPLLEASAQKRPGFEVPLYSPPDNYRRPVLRSDPIRYSY